MALGGLELSISLIPNQVSRILLNELPSYFLQFSPTEITSFFQLFMKNSFVPKTSPGPSISPTRRELSELFKFKSSSLSRVNVRTLNLFSIEFYHRG